MTGAIIGQLNGVARCGTAPHHPASRLTRGLSVAAPVGVGVCTASHRNGFQVAKRGTGHADDEGPNPRGSQVVGCDLGKIVDVGVAIVRIAIGDQHADHFTVGSLMLRGVGRHPP